MMKLPPRNWVSWSRNVELFPIMKVGARNTCMTIAQFRRMKVEFSTVPISRKLAAPFIWEAKWHLSKRIVLLWETDTEKLSAEELRTEKLLSLRTIEIPLKLKGAALTVVVLSPLASTVVEEEVAVISLGSKKVQFSTSKDVTWGCNDKRNRSLNT